MAKDKKRRIMLNEKNFIELTSTGTTTVEHKDGHVEVNLTDIGYRRMVQLLMRNIRE